MLTIFLTLLVSSSYGLERTPPFEKEVNSKSVKATCTGEIKDTFIFSINLVDSNQAHEFLVMKGLDPETCTLLRGKVKRILENNKSVIVSGFAGSHDEKYKGIVHQWKLIKGKRSCVSWFEEDCKK